MPKKSGDTHNNKIFKFLKISKMNVIKNNNEIENAKINALITIFPASNCIIGIPVAFGKYLFT